MKMLRAAGDFVGVDIEFDVFRLLVVVSDLATPDAVTAPAVVFHALSGKLAQVRLPDAALDKVSRNIALDTLEPRIARNHRLDFGDQLCGFLVVERVEIARVPPVVDSGSLDDKRRVDLR